MPSNTDPLLLDALAKAYAARAKLFHSGVRSSKLDLLIAEIDGIDGSGLDWTGVAIGISTSALAKVREAGGDLQQVFAHPEIIKDRPHLVAYYRNIVAISKKGIGQILFPTERYESGRTSEMPLEKAIQLCVTLNRIISSVIDSDSEYTVELSRQAAIAEIGTELQGTWANVVGKGAAKAVEGLFADYLEARNLGNRVQAGAYKLNHGWQILFASEPDVAFVDSSGLIRIAIEIKGSLDKAGAQTRYGETKKSFAKALKSNPRCHTIYLASCFTSAVIDQLKTDGTVRDWFNLTSILYDEADRNRFLDSVFYLVQTPR